MDVNQATNFLVCSILTGFGFILVAAIVVVINNIFAAFWKPIIWSNMLPEDMFPQRYADQQEMFPKK